MWESLTWGCYPGSKSTANNSLKSTANFFQLPPLDIWSLAETRKELDYTTTSMCFDNLLSTWRSNINAWENTNGLDQGGIAVFINDSKLDGKVSCVIYTPLRLPCETLCNQGSRRVTAQIYGSRTKSCDVFRQSSSYNTTVPQVCKM